MAVKDLPYVREDECAITVNLDGVKYGDSWDSIAGGERDANTVKIRIPTPGGYREVDIGGPSSRGDVTVGIVLNDTRIGWFKSFDSRSGKGIMNVTCAITDSNGTVVNSWTFKGVCKTVTPPDMDVSNVSPDKANLTVVMSANEELAG